MYIPDNQDAHDEYEVERDRNKRLFKRLSELERMEDYEYDAIRIDWTV